MTTSTPSARRRDALLTVRVSSTELEALHQLARERGVSISELVRRSLIPADAQAAA